MSDTASWIASCFEHLVNRLSLAVIRSANSSINFAVAFETDCVVQPSIGCLAMMSNSSLISIDYQYIIADYLRLVDSRARPVRLFGIAGASPPECRGDPISRGSTAVSVPDLLP